MPDYITNHTIQQLVALGKTKAAIEDFKSLLQSLSDPELEKSITMLSGRYYRLQEEVHQLTISPTDAKTEEARLLQALLEYLEIVPDTARVERTRGILKPGTEKPEAPTDTTIVDRHVSPIPPHSPSTSGIRKILFLASNPEESTRLRLDQEIRQLDEGLKMAAQRDKFDLVSKWAVRVKDLRRAIMEERPQIVHFSGHGAVEGLILENESGAPQVVPATALGNFFALFADQVECVVLNACYSEHQAAEIVRYIPYVIGMQSAVPDRAAIEFSVAFYDALGSGRDVEFAFRYACTAIELEGLAGSQLPIMRKRTV